MSQSSNNSNKKSQFPPRKRSPSSSSTNSQAQTINCKECIINYQKDIQLLKGRIQELENHIDKLSEPDLELIQLHQLAQVEWNKLSEENAKLKKLVVKDNAQNKDTDPSLEHLENQKLKAELEKKNAIIREMANQPFFSSSLSNDENQLKKLTIENMRLKNELQNANLALALNNNVMSLDTFNKILLEKQKNKVEPNEEIRLLQDENKSLRIQINELESEIYEISNNNPELQASLEAERQLRKLNKELEEKVHKLEIQLKSGNKQTDISNQFQEDDKNILKKPNKKQTKLDDLDDILDDDELFEKEIESIDDGFVTLKNTSDEDDEDELENQQLNKKSQNKEFELKGDMAMFSAILAPLKKRLDERCRQIEIEKMKEQGVFAPIKDANEKGEKDDENGLGVDLLDDNKNDTDKENENDNN